MKRLGIFIFYDRDGIVDDYVTYLINDLNKNLSHLSIISNSKILDSELPKLQRFTDDIVIRENKGLDAGALYEYFTRRDDYKDYDEIVFLNDTFYGPLYPFKEVFDEMDNKKLDFWGLTKGAVQVDGWKEYKDGVQPEHIQTFFVVLKKQVYNDPCFIDYWKKYDIKNMNTFKEVVSRHETRFTKYLSDHGFKYDVLVHNKYETDKPVRNYNTYAYSAADQIVNRKAPFIKRKNFVFETKNTMWLEDKPDINIALNYIENNTNYDTSLIWKNIIRLYNPQDIKNTIGVNTIIEETSSKKEDVTAIIKLNNVYTIPDIEGKLSMFKDYSILTSNKEVMHILDKKNIKYISYDDDYQLKYIKAIKSVKAEYIVSLNLDDRENSIVLVDASNNEMIIDNLIRNEKFLSGVISEMNKNNVGIVYAPETLSYIDFYKSMYWDATVYSNIRKKHKDMFGMINKKKTPISFQTSFIIKKSIFDSIDFDNWPEEKEVVFIPTLSILLQYYAQKELLRPIISYNKEFAFYRFNNESIMLSETYKGLFDGLSLPTDYTGLVNLLNNLGYKNIIKLFIRKLGSRFKNKVYYPIRNRVKKLIGR